MVTWLLSRQVQKPFEARFQDLKDQLDARAAEARAAMAKLECAQIELSESRAQNEGLLSKIEERDSAHAQRMEELKNARLELSNEFKALSGEALKASSEQLVAQAEEVLKRYREAAEGDDESRKKEIESLLNPVRDNLQKLDEQNQQMERHRVGAYRELIEQVSSLKVQQAGLTKETTRLVKALQDPGTAGDWGEVALERVVEKAGLEEYVSFVTQATLEGDDGRARPDMIVHLPGDRCLIIDSKAPMRSYIEALETEDETIKQTFLTDHANKLLGHAKDLKKRDYPRLVGKAPDFVVLFVGSEAAYHAAHIARKTLNEEVWDCNVVLSSPNSLLGLLRAVNYGWQQEKLAASAKELQADAAQLYERISKIANDYVNLGRALSAATRKFNEMGATLESRVLPAARKFKEHGVQSNSELAVIEPIEFSPRPLQSPELASRRATSALPGLE